MLAIIIIIIIRLWRPTKANQYSPQQVPNLLPDSSFHRTDSKSICPYLNMYVITYPFYQVLMSYLLGKTSINRVIPLRKLLILWYVSQVIISSSISDMNSLSLLDFCGFLNFPYFKPWLRIFCQLLIFFSQNIFINF